MASTAGRTGGTAAEMRTEPGTHGLPHRPALLVLQSLVAVAGLEGAAQLMAGVATPPVEDLPAGLGSWVLPGLWLLASVAVPSGTAAWLVWRRSPRAPVAVLVASAALAVELLVQVPFLGPSVLQLVLGLVAGLSGWLAWDARRRGWATPG